jgi:hypothetical protein
MHSIHREGRLVLMRVTAPVTAADTDDLVGQVRMNIIAAPAKVVFFADLTGAGLLPAEVEAPIVTTFMRDNAKIERSAIVVAAGKSGLTLQIERLVRDAKNPNRRAFDQPDAAVRWASELLTEAEQTSLQGFVAAALHSKSGARSIPPASHK